MEKKQISFKLKVELSEEARKEIEGLLAKRLKASIAKDKSKGNKGRWVLKLKKPEELNVEALEEIFKKAGVKKIVRDVSIEDDDDD